MNLPKTQSITRRHFQQNDTNWKRRRAGIAFVQSAKKHQRCWKILSSQGRTLLSTNSANVLRRLLMRAPPAPDPPIHVSLQSKEQRMSSISTRNARGKEGTLPLEVFSFMERVTFWIPFLDSRTPLKQEKDVVSAGSQARYVITHDARTAASTTDANTRERTASDHTICTVLVHTAPYTITVTIQLSHARGRAGSPPKKWEEPGSTVTKAASLSAQLVATCWVSGTPSRSPEPLHSMKE